MGFVLGGGGGEDVVWGLFWGVGVVLGLLGGGGLGGGVTGNDYES